MYKTLNAPLAAHLEINTGCNQQCRHCYNFWRDDKSNADTSISEELAAQIINQLHNNKVFHVILTGGEPLLNKSTLLFVMGELSKRNITFSLNSNLALLTEKSAKELRTAGLKTVLTSLLSYDAATHDFLSNTKESFARVVRGIKFARGAGLRVGVNMVVTKNNLSHVSKTGEFARELGAFAFSATRVVAPRTPTRQLTQELLLAPDDVKMIAKQMLFLTKSGLKLDSLIPYPTCFFDNKESQLLFGQRACSAGKTSLTIASDGAVRACPHHEVAYGSLSTDNLSSIWLKMNQWRDGSLIPQTCLSCQLISVCGGGCRVASADGNICGEDIIMKKINYDYTFINKTNPISVISAGTALRVRICCRFRKDKEIGVINTGGIKNTFVTHETLEVFKNAHSKKLIFTPTILRNAYGIIMDDADYARFLSELVAREVLEYAV